MYTLDWFWIISPRSEKWFIAKQITEMSIILMSPTFKYNTYNKNYQFLVGPLWYKILKLLYICTCMWHIFSFKDNGNSYLNNAFYTILCLNKFKLNCHWIKEILQISTIYMYISDIERSFPNTRIITTNYL